MSEQYLIVNENEKAFLDLCGHYTIVAEFGDASRWDDINHKAMWFYLHELEATTNYSWHVVAMPSHQRVAEPKEARTFDLVKNFSIENQVYSVTLEEKTFNQAFKDSKPVVKEDYFAELFINGKTRYIPVAKVENKYYRYKHSLKEPAKRLDYWKW